MYIHTHIYTHTHTHTHIHTYIHTYTHIHTHAHTYIHTYIQTYIDIHIQTRMQTHNVLSQYFNTSVRNLAVTSLCLYDLLKLPSSSSLNPLILLGNSVYGCQDSLRDVKS